jgi:hypothetical protein
MVIRNEHRLQQFNLFVSRPVHEVWQVLQFIKVCDNLESVALIDQELLPLRAVVHFLCIFRYKGIEEGVEALIISPFCTQDTA